MSYFFIKKQTKLIPDRVRGMCEVHHAGDVVDVVPNDHIDRMGFCPGDIKHFHIVSSRDMPWCNCVDKSKVCDFCRDLVQPWTDENGRLLRLSKWKYDISQQMFQNKVTKNFILANPIEVLE